MTEKYTTQLQCMSDLRTGYFHGWVIWQSNDRLNYAVFELLLTIPCILDWLLCYICDFPIKVYTPTRHDRIVDFYYPILSCFWEMISVPDPNPVLVEIILSVSENYPKVHCVAQHTFLCCIYFASCGKITERQNNCWSYSAFSWTRFIEVVTWEVWNACPA